MALLEEPIRSVRDLRNYIGGEWVESRGSLVDVVNPATGGVIARVPQSTPEDVRAAIDALRKRFRSGAGRRRWLVPECSSDSRS